MLCNRVALGTYRGAPQSIRKYIYTRTYTYTHLFIGLSLDAERCAGSGRRFVRQTRAGLLLLPLRLVRSQSLVCARASTSSRSLRSLRIICPRTLVSESKSYARAAALRPIRTEYHSGRGRGAQCNTTTTISFAFHVACTLRATRQPTSQHGRSTRSPNYVSWAVIIIIAVGTARIRNTLLLRVCTERVPFPTPLDPIAYRVLR